MKIDECIQELIQELAPDQGASPSRAFSLVLSLQAALASRPSETPKTLKASQSSSAWSEAFMVDGDDGPVMGIVIDMPDGRQIWTGECSDKLLSESVDAGESPEGSGIYLSASAKGDGARVIASVGTVNDAEDLARGLALLWSEASTSRQCCKELYAKAVVLDYLLSPQITGQTAKTRLMEYRSGILQIDTHKGQQS